MKINYYEELKRIEKVRISIKDPIHYYAEYDITTGEVKYLKKKKSKDKRVVVIKVNNKNK